MKTMTIITSKLYLCLHFEIMMYLSITLMVNSQSEYRFEIILICLILEQDHIKINMV